MQCPATFQRLMESVLAGLTGDTCIVHIDNILVMGETTTKPGLHVQSLTTGRPSAQCHLARCEVEYLGYIVSDKGIATDPRKIEAVRTFPVPSDLKHLQSFVGIALYYKSFISNFAKVANPLHALTRKDTSVVLLWI